MKALSCTFLLCLFSWVSWAGHEKNDVRQKLVEINACWNEQEDVANLTIPIRTLHSDQDWIALHLELVENTLRKRDVSHLSAVQRQNRMQCLDYLHDYLLSRNFPINEVFTYRRPIFIDPYDNFCAVGFLVKATGFEQVSRKIARETNYAYVREMNYPELLDWASSYGFTVDELAWIQPAYAPPPDRMPIPIGKGTNGEVIEFFADHVNDRLYVGGQFSLVDSTIVVGGIAYLTPDGNGDYEWHGMGSGVNGTVRAIINYDNKIFVGGEFTEAGGNPVQNIAYWDGTDWHAAGCINGVVHDLIVFNNNIYAAGDFDVCIGSTETNFAVWNGSSWTPIDGMVGTVYKMETTQDDIVLGGNFSFGMLATQVNVIKWNPTQSFQHFYPSMNAIVKDFEWFQGDMYALCDFVPGDTMLVKKLSGNTWQTINSFFNKYYTNLDGEPATLNTLCAHGDTLMAGGDFFHGGMMWDPMISNCVDVFYDPNNSTLRNWLLVDSMINIMTVFNGELFVGGKFRYGGPFFYMEEYELNSIARKGYTGTTSVGKHITNPPQDIELYPNPIQTGSTLYINSSTQVEQIRMMDITGRQVATYSLSAGQKSIHLPQLTPGIYIMECIANHKPVFAKRVIIQE